MSKHSLTSRLYRLAARSFPDDVRASHGAEIIETALDFGDGRFSIREAGALVAQGLRTRARHGLSGDTNSLLISALRIGLFLFYLESWVSIAASKLFFNEPGSQAWWIATAAIAPAIMMVSTGRITALVQLVVWAAGWIWLMVDIGTGVVFWPFFAASLVIMVGIAVVAWRGDGRRVMSPLAGLAVTGVALALTWLSGPGVQIMFAVSPNTLLLILTIAAALVLPFDPRLAAGAACFLSLSAAWAIVTWSANLDVAQGVARELFLTLGIVVVVVGALALASRRGARRLERL